MAGHHAWTLLIVVISLTLQLVALYLAAGVWGAEFLMRP